jgi:heme A synthase
MKIARIVYLITSWLFVAGVAVQVFLAGMVVVAGQMAWSSHGDLGHSLGLPLIIMLISAYVGRMPASIKRLTWLLLGVYILQADVFILMRQSAPAISALHPLMALLDFALGLTLAIRAWSLLKKPQVDQAFTTSLEAVAAD